MSEPKNDPQADTRKDALAVLADKLPPFCPWWNERLIDNWNVAAKTIFAQMNELQKNAPSPTPPAQGKEQKGED